jgi:DNA mismatch repair protein MutL
MSLGIETLPLDVVHLIAAGEVIDSLAAAVRELAENALDAGATRITISLYPEQWRIRVADNGRGMNLEDLRSAATPHSTSKIRTSQDLWRVTSLGFRGEALHSLAQLADLEIISRSVDSDAGWWAAYNSQGEAVQTEPCAIAPGTVVIADRLFANWSARREGLPPLPQQLKAVQATIYQLALCHPHVTWVVQQNDRDWFNLWLGRTARQILPQILPSVQEGDLREWVGRVERVEGGEAGGGEGGGDGGDGGDGRAKHCPLSTIHYPPSTQNPLLYLLLGLPDRCHRHRPDWVRVAINGRFVQFPELEQTLLQGFRRTLPRDRFPVCLVHLRVPPAQVDWNRHPAKLDVYLHQLDFWRKQVEQAVDQALRLNSTSLPDALHLDRTTRLLKTAEAEGRYQLPANHQPDTNSESQTSPPLPSPLKAIAQVHNTYILAEHPTGVWLVEQHIAHERVLYEQVCDRWRMIPLPSPVILNPLTPTQAEQLQRLGIELEPFGEQAWMVRSAPELLAERADCADALLELSLGGDLQTAQVATACRSAIRNGTSLSLEQMQTILNQWQQTRNPRTCPHGRPICLTLEESALSRFFRRHWVIGKSHGI